MSERRPTLQPGYFEDIYARDTDPWRFRTSRYEADKYAATLGSLGRDRYGSALEVGCSIGVFTRLLAQRCDRLLAIDVSDRALDIARHDARDLPQVEFRRAAVPGGFPAGRYDLIVLSEVLYYLGVADLHRTADLVTEAIEPGGEVVLCHWLGESDYPLSGHEATTAFIEATKMRLQVRRSEPHPEYRLELLSPIGTGLASTRTGGADPA